MKGTESQAALGTTTTYTVRVEAGWNGKSATGPALTLLEEQLARGEIALDGGDVLSYTAIVKAQGDQRVGIVRARVMHGESVLSTERIELKVGEGKVVKLGSADVRVSVSSR